MRKSVEVNPAAHFGRERWQAEVDSFRLAAVDDTGLRQFDCLGIRLNLTIEEALNREGNWIDTGFGRPTDAEFSQGKAFLEVPAFITPGTDPADLARWEELSPIRRHITRVGGDRGREPVAFDEPVIAVVGMWRQVRGADPHFALALGETMLRVGQRQIAWAAYERAHRLADRYAPDPALRDFLRAHCRARQADIERTLSHAPPADSRRLAWENVTPPRPAEVTGLRARFEAELAHGEAYQRAYQEYEERQIAAGVPPDDPHFFDAFYVGRDPIASPVGPEEWFAWVPRARMAEYTAERRHAWGTVGAGLAAVLAAAVMRFNAGCGQASRGRQPPASPPATTESRG